MAKKRVFVCYDYGHDKALKELMTMQARNPDSPFEITGFSQIVAAPEKDWVEKTRKAISNADVFIIMLGPKAKKTPGVLKELKIASDLKLRTFQIIGYKFGTEEWAVPGGGEVYKWDWANIKKLLA